MSKTHLYPTALGMVNTCEATILQPGP